MATDERTNMTTATLSDLQRNALRDAYITACKDTVLDDLDTPAARAELALVIEEARAVWTRGFEAVALNCEARVPMAETQDERERWLRLADRFWNVA